jgi:hypothetical protein
MEERSALALARAYLLPRVRLVGGAVLVGGGGGLVLFVVLALTDRSTVTAARVAFVIGSVALGFGLLGWSGSALAGRGFETMQEHLETGTDWTEVDSRRAMARIGGFGAGAMAVTGVVELLALTA